MLLTLIAVGPEFDKVTGCEALVVATCCAE